MLVNVPKGTVKTTCGNYVIYDRDYLLENLPREIYLLEGTRQVTAKIDKEYIEKVMKDLRKGVEK